MWPIPRKKNLFNRVGRTQRDTYNNRKTRFSFADKKKQEFNVKQIVSFNSRGLSRNDTIRKLYNQIGIESDKLTWISAARIFLAARLMMSTSAVGDVSWVTRVRTSKAAVLYCSKGNSEIESREKKPQELFAFLNTQ